MPPDLKGGCHETVFGIATNRPCRASAGDLKGGAAKKVIDKLLKEKLLQELHLKDDMPVWRRGDDSRPYSLRISACNNTKEGMEKKEGHPISVLSEAVIVPSGVVRLMELQEKGWSYLRP